MIDQWYFNNRHVPRSVLGALRVACPNRRGAAVYLLLYSLWLMSCAWLAGKICSNASVRYRLAHTPACWGWAQYSGQTNKAAADPVIPQYYILIRQPDDDSPAGIKVLPSSFSPSQHYVLLVLYFVVYDGEHDLSETKLELCSMSHLFSCVCVCICVHTDESMSNINVVHWVKSDSVTNSCNSLMRNWLDQVVHS